MLWRAVHLDELLAVAFSSKCLEVALAAVWWFNVEARSSVSARLWSSCFKVL